MDNWNCIGDKMVWFEEKNVSDAIASARLFDDELKQLFKQNEIVLVKNASMNYDEYGVVSGLNSLRNALGHFAPTFTGSVQFGRIVVEVSSFALKAILDKTVPFWRKMLQFILIDTALSRLQVASKRASKPRQLRLNLSQIGLLCSPVIH